MSDFDSSLPVRTQQNGDVVTFLADATTPSQLAKIDSFGSQQNVLKDASGNAIGSELISSSYWLQVVMPGNGPSAPGTASAFSVLAGGIYNLTPPTLTDGQQASLQLDPNGRLLVDANIVDTRDTNYGTVGSNTIRSASQIGNATGAADFNWGSVGAQTLRVAAEIGNATGAADFNAGATGAQTLRVSANQGAPNSIANAWPVKPTDGTNSQAYTASGEAKVDITQPLPAGTNLIGSVNVEVGGSPISPSNPLSVLDGSDGPVSPGTAASYSSLAGGVYNSVLPTFTNGQQGALQLDSNGRLLVDASFTSTDDHNYGTVGANTLRTASQIGNATGAANFNYGAVGAQTLRVASQIGNATGAADFNSGATGAQTLRVEANQGAPASIANAWPTKITDGTNTVSVTASGEIKVDVTSALPAGANLIGSVNVDVGGVAVSPSNPLPVTIEDAPGTHINDFKIAGSIASGASDNHDYTVTAGKTLHLTQVESSASGKAKMTISIETGVATGVFTNKFFHFNSTAETNMSVILSADILVAAGVRVRVVMQNRDLASEDIYSTICGYEV